MRQEFSQPMGMKDTDFYEMDLPVANYAFGYTRDHWFGPEDGQLRNHQFIYGIKGSPSEHGFSTVQDLFLFLRALQSHQLLDDHHTEPCTTPQTAGDQPDVSYGYGFHILDDGRHGRVIGPGGRALGGDAFALIYRDIGYMMIVLSNYDRPAIRKIMNEIADMLIA